MSCISSTYPFGLATLHKTWFKQDAKKRGRGCKTSYLLPDGQKKSLTVLLKEYSVAGSLGLLENVKLIASGTQRFWFVDGNKNTLTTANSVASRETV